MSKIAISDFDGVIANITEHTKIAQERAKAFALELALDPKEEAYRKALSSFFYSERGFFDNELVKYDQLMSGCGKALAQFSQEYDKVIVLTSRPSSMREATLQWFSQQCPGYESIQFIFKDSNESVMKTAVWKANTVAYFAEQYEAVLFIDDDERNREAVKALATELNNIAIFVKSCFEEYFLTDTQNA